MNNLFYVYRPPKRLYKSLRIYQLLRVYKLLVRCRTVRMTSFSTRKSLLTALTTIQSLLGIRSRILLLSLLLALVLALMVSLLLLLLLSHPLGLHYHSRLISINSFWIYLGGAESACLPQPRTEDTSVPVTPSSPTRGRMIPPHQGGHRRNGSEFIGSDGKNGLTGLMSTSPTKGEGPVHLEIATSCKAVPQPRVG